MSPMLILLARRVGAAALTLLLVSMVVFTISSLLPGDAAQETLGQSATPEAVAALRAQLGLNVPAHLRYLHWLGGLLSGDPGRSMTNNLPVREIIAGRLPKSLLLAGMTAAVAVPIALAIGILSAMYRGSRLDRALNVLTLSMVAVPEFLVATVAVLIFAVKLRWLPSLTMVPEHASLGEFLRAYALPVMTLCFVIIAQMARMTRAAVIDQLNQPYVEMATLKGLRPSRVAFVHALPNAIGPIVNAVALSLMVDAVTSRDMPLLQACAMIFCTAYLLLVLIADVCAILANPRLRSQ